MIGLLPIALTLLAPPQGMEAIRINTRDMSALHSRDDVIRGTCDGRPVSVTITKAYRGARGRVMFRSGRWVRALPPSFLNGGLLSSGLKSAELACDGRRVQLSGLAIRQNAQGEFVLEIQNAILDLRTGVLTLTELRTLSPAETRSELHPMP